MLGPTIAHFSSNLVIVLTHKIVPICAIQPAATIEPSWVAVALRVPEVAQVKYEVAALPGLIKASSDYKGSRRNKVLLHYMIQLCASAEWLQIARNHNSAGRTGKRPHWHAEPRRLTVEP